ncbi:Ribonuclease E [Streptomyces violaceorubidus]
MTVRVVRDIFNEDFSKVVVSGDDAWQTIHGYVSHVAPDLAERLSRWTSEVDVFATYRIDEQLAKALDRKVWLPSGGSLVIDRTEAMVVIDVNTGKFTGQGGNLEETVTRNNLEAAEEIVRQLRLRDLGGIIVIDFIDMVLESNRDLVLRRLLECLGRDRTKHQVAEVTSLGLVQMTRKRVGQGLLESFSETCVHCNGRGVIVHLDQPASAAGGGGGKRRKRARAGGEQPHEHEAAAGVETGPRRSRRRTPSPSPRWPPRWPSRSPCRRPTSARTRSCTAAPPRPRPPPRAVAVGVAPAVGRPLRRVPPGARRARPRRPVRSPRRRRRRTSRCRRRSSVPCGASPPPRCWPSPPPSRTPSPAPPHRLPPRPRLPCRRRPRPRAVPAAGPPGRCPHRPVRPRAPRPPC